MHTVIVMIIALLVNIPLGSYRTRYRKLSLMWFVMVHASIPLMIPLRIWLGTPAAAIPLFIGSAIAGQWIGARLARNQ